MIESEAELRATLTASDVALRYHETLVRYLIHNREPGGFLMAVLQNDLVTAVQAADQTAWFEIPALVRFLHNHVPHRAVFSPERVRAWLARRIVSG